MSENAFIRALQHVRTSVTQWVDSDYIPGGALALKSKPEQVEWVRTLPFLFLHLGCLGVIWTGWSWTAVATAIGLYFIRMFSVTGFFHRYFSHRTFSTSQIGRAHV